MEPFQPFKSGHIEVICGPMFSGKTEELIRRLRRAQIARQNVVVFKPSIDNRYDDVQIVSHSAQKAPSIPIENAAAIEQYLQRLSAKINVVGIDEAQFFDSDLIGVVERLAEQGIRVVVAGLDQDYLGKPFGPMPHLLAIAEVVVKQHAVCVVCGASASKTQRIQKQNGNCQSEEKVLVGALDDYEARCRGCYFKGVASPVLMSVASEAFAV